MQRLKKGFIAAVERYSADDTPYAICTWDTGIFWPPIGQRWARAADKVSMLQWVNEQRARGGNDMANAITLAAKSGPLKDTVCHLVVMCDGDISPFSVDSSGGRDWATFHKSLPPNVRSCSFVAFTDSADAKMQRMAEIGLGNFYNY